MTPSSPNLSGGGVALKKAGISIDYASGRRPQCIVGTPRLSAVMVARGLRPASASLVLIRNANAWRAQQIALTVAAARG
jgi:hypothetical protein